MTHASDGDLQPYVATEYLALGDALSPLGAAGGRVPRRSQPRRDPWPGRNRTARALAPSPG